MFGEKLKLLRIKNKLTQKELANILGIARITYSHYESNERMIPIERLNVIVNHYNVSIDYIFNTTKIINYKNNKIINQKISSIRIKEFRKDNNLTQEKLAKELNTTKSTISGYENNRFLISTPFLYQICKKYKASADYLLGRTNSPKYIN